MIKRLIHQEDTILSVYTLINRTSKYIKQKLIDLQGEIDKSLNIVRDFNTSHSIIRITRQKISMDIEYLNTINQPDPMHVCRTPHQTLFTFFSSTHGTFTYTDCILGHNTSLNKFKGIQVIKIMFSTKMG